MKKFVSWFKGLRMIWKVVISVAVLAIIIGALATPEESTAQPAKVEVKQEKPHLTKDDITTIYQTTGIVAASHAKSKTNTANLMNGLITEDDAGHVYAESEIAAEQATANFMAIDAIKRYKQATPEIKELRNAFVARTKFTHLYNANEWELSNGNSVHVTEFIDAYPDAEKADRETRLRLINALDPVESMQK